MRRPEHALPNFSALLEEIGLESIARSALGEPMPTAFAHADTILGLERILGHMAATPEPPPTPPLGARLMFHTPAGLILIWENEGVPPGHVRFRRGRRNHQSPA